MHRTAELSALHRAAKRRKIAGMNPTRIIAIILLVAGALALVYGGFSYTKDTTAVKLGPIELTVKEKETFNVPMWVGIGALVVGGLLLVVGGKRG
jgi:drug/metabolite transporter (DMT)-like permease